MVKVKLRDILSPPSTIRKTRLQHKGWRMQILWNVTTKNKIRGQQLDEQEKTQSGHLRVFGKCRPLGN